MDYSWIHNKIELEDKFSYVDSLTQFLIDGFYSLIRSNTASFEECDLINIESAPTPMLITNYDEYKVAIRLTVKDTRFWCQIIYQLSHELCHYFIRQYKDKEITVKWFEETVCEAVSLYFLDYSIKNWNLCKLSINYPNYSKYIDDYLSNILLDPYIEKLSTINNFSQMNEIELNSENERSWRVQERNKLFSILTKYPENFYCVLEYTKYLRNNKLLFDFESWEKDYKDNHIISFFRSIQPKM